jgi:hypothetical protein
VREGIDFRPFLVRTPRLINMRIPRLSSFIPCLEISRRGYHTPRLAFLSAFVAMSANRMSVSGNTAQSGRFYHTPECLSVRECGNSPGHSSSAPHPNLDTQHAAQQLSSRAAAASYRGNACETRTMRKMQRLMCPKRLRLRKTHARRTEEPFGRSAGAQAAAHVGVDVC